jgi:hypothetical protein
MKKITLGVTALSIVINGFSTNPPTKQELIKEMSLTTEDMIKSMRMTNDTVTQCYSFVQMSEIYVHNLLDMLSKLEDLQMLEYNKDNKTLNLDWCENCDEID